MFFLGMMVLRILVHSLGSFFASSSFLVRDCFLSYLMRFASLFRYCACVRILSGVGCWIRSR